MRGAGRRRSWVVCLLLGWAVLLVACSGSDDDEGAATSSTVRRSTTTTAAPTVEEQVEAAYLRSWDVYAKAVRELDSTGLEETYAERALDVVRQDVARLKAAQTPAQIAVDHNYVIQVRTDAQALVFDKYANNSVLLDPRTGEETEREGPSEVEETYEMRLVGGEWKVVGITRVE